ncbi:hypothetical protein BDD43_2326 [Mucilaginibacter gracilis]|uniref:Uncharacterized protein n=1 Tax=Mucilaginibacter gracilis TaxID=423350 RepID=A0A495IZN8_9SPHI|nr:hypothetical protein [Mucilaginibacter gracilis]RKR82157.1 hypothetical protein BDD43_2326 [Mucilaginibacter gracilis]
MTLINIPFTENIDNLLAYGKKQSKDYEGSFEGNTSNGIFDFKAVGGNFKGTYVVKPNLIEITLEKKPFLIPALVIEQFLKMHIK